jgi:light-regulated signal transduction histidine kinase (bacteriophytochrome)
MQGPTDNLSRVVQKSEPAVPAQVTMAPAEGRAESSVRAESLEDPETERLRKTVEVLSYALHGLSHDLREPIRTVSCYSRLLHRNSLIQQDANLIEYAHLIAGAAQRMDTLLARMLDYSRLLGQQAQPLSRVDMNVVVQTALANLHLKIEETRATIVADALPQVSGDYVQLTELIQNLVGNGLKYRGAAPPQVLIRSEQRDTEWVFSIADNGVGIDPRYHESIFEPFKRLHGDGLPGAGLGLAICRQIVDRHYGRIWVESVPGQGSTFQFTFPGTA